jgi:glutamate racemase
MDSRLRGNDTTNANLNMQKNSNNPIGIFDSGIGGLTVAHAVTRTLPHENIIYFGDTAHLPWGDKSTAAIQAYSIKICEMLLKQECKIILIACNTASAAAYDLVKEYVGSKAIVIDVIEPMVNHLREHYAHKSVGLIGTKQTIHSNIYKKKLDALNVGIKLNALATPLLVPLIEEGFAEKKITAETLHEYLSHGDLKNIEALVLGCTHYPLIKRHAESFYKNKVAVIDSSEIVAIALKGLLHYHNLNNHQKTGEKRFYVSDYTETFTASARLFFQEEVKLEQYPLWE